MDVARSSGIARDAEAGPMPTSTLAFAVSIEETACTPVTAVGIVPTLALTPAVLVHEIRLEGTTFTSMGTYAP